MSSGSGAYSSSVGIVAEEREVSEVLRWRRIKGARGRDSKSAKMRVSVDACFPKRLRESARFSQKKLWRRMRYRRDDLVREPGIERQTSAFSHKTLVDTAFYAL